MAYEACELDVRPLLAAGCEPFQQIMDAVENLAPGQPFRLLAPFKPFPLFQVMERRGFAYTAEHIGDGDWLITFTPPDTETVRVSPNAQAPEAWPDPVHSIDLSHLPPSEALARIQALTGKYDEGDILFALLARDPREALPRLEARGHQWVGGNDGHTGTYRLLVRVGKPH